MSTANAPVRRRLQNARRPLLVWTGMVAYLGVVTLMVSTIMPTDFVDASQAGFFEMQGWIAMSVLGAIGVFLSTRTGFPDPVSGEISPWRRFGLPVAIGLIGGVIFLLTDIATGLSRTTAEEYDLPSSDIGFPASLFVYSAASVYVEIVFRLLPIPLFMLIISNLILRGRGATPVFWILAVLTSMIEPLSQTSSQVLAPLPWAVVLTESFAVNLAQAAVFRRFGFLASILVRVAFYAIYHMIGAPFKA
jgi:hypothetical protein